MAFPSRLARRAIVPTLRFSSTLLSQRSLQAQARLLSASAAPKRRGGGTWKGTFLRWGTAGTALWWYSTSPLFAEDQEPQTIPPPAAFSDEDLPTVSAVVAQKRAALQEREREREEQRERERRHEREQKASSSTAQSVTASPAVGEGPQEEAQGAYNPETGEINWDCPCLGGMAHGPCGEEFKTAFSCFVFSKEEPKGMDCIDKFQGMQDCFKKHPEIYGDELRDDDGDDGQPATGTEAAAAPQARDAAAEKVVFGENEEQSHKGTSPGEVEDLDRRADARGIDGARDEAGEGRRVDAEDANHGDGKGVSKAVEKESNESSEKESSNESSEKKSNESSEKKLKASS